MKRFNQIALLFVFIIAFSSCYKKAINYDPNFGGFWKSIDNEHNIEIGRTVYTATYWNSNDQISGKAKTNGNVFKIGSVRFEINQLPTLDSTNTDGIPIYSMILDSIVYISYKYN